MSPLYSLICCLCAVILLSSRLQAEEFSITLDGEDKYNLTWSFKSTSPSDEVTFTVTCETTGWVGLGLSPNGGMAGADIVVMWIDSSGKVHIKDMYAEANGLPTLDKSQDYTLVSGWERDGISQISFKRKIRTCDSEGDNDIETATTRLIYAYGSDDPTDNIVGFGDKHLSNKRGAKSIYLLDPQQASPSTITDDALSFDLTINDYVLPTDKTTYYCSFYDPPKLSSKHHVIATEPIIQPGNEGFVHHILVYGCFGLSKEHIRNNNKTEGTCYSSEMPEFLSSCRSVAFGWAIGGSKFYFPENVGFTIGTDDQNSPQYYMMEMHYDNPQGIEGRSDASGLRLIYTPTLRKDDAGLLQVGNVFGIFVPPKTDEFKVTAYCHSSCTRKWVPEGGVTIFGYLLHAHLLGVGIKLEHYREGKELEILAEDKAYDFNYQEQRQFYELKKLMPGDTIKITCTYKSTDRDFLTIGGESTSQEMCLTFLSYYPKQNIANCEALPGYITNRYDSLYSGLSLKPEVSRNVGIFPVFDVYKALYTVTDWNTEKVEIAQKSYEDTYALSYCVAHEGTLIDLDLSDMVIDPSLYPTIEEKSDNGYCDMKEERGAGSSNSRSITIFSVMLCILFM